MLDVLNVLKPILADIFCEEEANISPATRFDEDLGADELDLQEILMTVEEEFDCTVPFDEAVGFGTVGDLITYIEGKRND